MIESAARQPTFTGFPPNAHMLCPMCNYALNGLPAVHACPECGFEYDEDTQVWLGRMHKSLLILLIVVGIFQLASPAMKWLDAYLNGMPRSWYPVYSSLPNLAVGLFVSWVCWRQSRRGWMASINPKGIAFSTPWRSRAMIPWNAIEGVAYKEGWRGNVVIIRLMSGRTRNIRGVFPKLQDSEAFQESANAQLSLFKDLQ
jgi:hypothetical protein